MKISFVRKYDNIEMCSVTIDSRFSGKTNATLLEALLVPAVVYSDRKKEDYGYFLVPKSLEGTLRARYHKEGDTFDKIFGYELRWTEE